MTGRRRGGGYAGEKYWADEGERNWGEALEAKAAQTKGKAKEAKGKSKGKTSKGDAQWAPSAANPVATLHGAKRVEELEAEMLMMKLQRGSGAPSDPSASRIPRAASAQDAGAQTREATKQPLEAKGNYCEVKKHSGMGCAVVSMVSKQAREGVMNLAMQRSPQPAGFDSQHGEEPRPTLNIDGQAVEMRNHRDKATGQDIETDIFLAWGRQAEKTSALSAASVSQAIDQLWYEACQGSVPTMQQVPTFCGQMAPSTMAVAPPLPSPMQTTGGQAMYDYSGMSMGVPQQHTPEVMYNVQVQQAQSYPGYYMDSLQHSNIDYNSYAQQAQPPATPERKSFRIVDPKTQHEIETPPRLRLPSDQQSPEKVHKPLKIIDPSSGDQIDVMNFTPAKATSKAKFQIIDPACGTAIMV
jgi:hypothetical protein